MSRSAISATLDAIQAAPKIGPVSMANKAALVKARSEGRSVAESCKEVGVSVKTYYGYLREPEFREMMAHAVKGVQEARSKELGLEDYRKAVLGRLTFPHMQQWGEWMESTENDHIMILCPPEAAKTTFVLDYILWRIYLDPDIRVGYVSKSLPHAIKQVSRIKNILEQNELMRKLCGDLVPGPGDPHPWRDSYFTVRTRSWTAGEDEADYTVAAFGAGSQITGSRFDLIIFDDPDDVNIGPTDREKVWNVILQAGESRLGTSGRMIVIGNRQDDEDVYKRILDQWHEEPELWAVYTQKAIGREPEWENGKVVVQPEVIWPEKFGLSTKRKVRQGSISPKGDWSVMQAWNFFDRKRRRLGHRFHLIYQNDPQGDREKDFTREMMESAFDQRYSCGSVPNGATIVCSMDPASSGGAAVLVYALLPPDELGRRRRMVVDFEWGTNWRYEGHIERIKAYGDKYHPRWWVIERSAHSSFLLQNPTVLDIIKNQGAWLYDLTTGANKENRDLGVSSNRVLFLEGALVLPAATQGDLERHRVLRQQLVDYYPDTTAPHDGPMSLWFAERCVIDKGLIRLSDARSGAKMSHWRSQYGNNWSGGSWSFKKPDGQPEVHSSGAILDPSVFTGAIV